MVNKPGWLEEAIAKPDGYYTVDGEKLKGVMLTPQQVDEWNGTTAPAADPEPEMLVEAPTAAADLNEMSKRELEELGREHGVELDRRESKSKLVAKMKKLVE
jgi:hypothetical protein|tara:strand:+ start:150 stop:455 length:306 start_codon:yes stop_codon:yes gene_type:complete